MVKWWEELCNVKYKSTHRQVLHPTCSNNVGKSNSCINHRFKLETTELTRMNKIIWSHIELEVFSNDFLNELADCIDEYDKPKGFGRVILFLVGFRDYDHSGFFEMWGPIFYFDTSISDADNDIETIIIFENSFQVTSWQLIRARSRWVIAVG